VGREAYAVAAQDVFDGLRGLIGQLSGLLILTQAGLCRDVPDHPEVAIARVRWQETLERLGRLPPSTGRAVDSARLREAGARIDGALGAITELRHTRTKEQVDVAAWHLGQAYRLLQAVCDHRVGLRMVDMGQACCGCGKTIEWDTSLKS
jgi:hypothetical protein